MIQRRQTLFLVLVFLINLILIITNPKYLIGELKFDKNDVFIYHMTMKTSVIESNPITEIKRDNIFYALIISGLMSFCSLFFYKKQALQLRFTAFNFLFLSLGIFYMFYAWNRFNFIENIEVLSSRFQWILILPFLTLVLNFLALKGIRKDIELLASVDRLR